MESWSDNDLVYLLVSLVPIVAKTLFGVIVLCLGARLVTVLLRHGVSKGNLARDINRLLSKGVVTLSDSPKTAEELGCLADWGIEALERLQAQCLKYDIDAGDFETWEEVGREIADNEA